MKFLITVKTKTKMLAISGPASSIGRALKLMCLHTNSNI